MQLGIPMPTPITISSPAKVNLVLDILRKREDGYHEIEIVMQELELHDILTLETLSTSTEIILSCTDVNVPLNEKNSCHKAAKLMQEELQKQNKPIQGVKIHIEKKIPSAGGLGGGSSNAASALKGLNKLWNLNLSSDTLVELAGKIGSDDAFFIRGGTAIARGRGEIIEPIEKCPRLELAFIVPPVKVPEQKTKWIYSNFDVNNVENHPSIMRMRAAIREKNVDKVVSEMGNVFDTLTMPEYSVPFALVEGLKQMPNVKQVMLAGSGPTIVCVCDSPKISSQIIEPFRARGWVAFATHTV